MGVVDATEIEVGRPTNSAQQKLFYSGKKKYHTAKFQLVVLPISGVIIHVAGPVPGSVHDIKLFDTSGVSSILRHREFIMGDSGYQGLESRGVECIIPRKKPRGSDRSREDMEFNAALSKHRVIVENVISRIKNFQIVGKKWRGRIRNLDDLQITFRLCAALVNVQKKCS